MSHNGWIHGPVRAALAATAVAAVLAACGGDSDGAGSQGSTGNLGPVSPAPGPGGVTDVLSVAVSGAFPVSGNALVSSATGGSSVLVSGTVRQVTADGSGGGLQHRFIITYDAVSGVVLSVVHAWGASIAAAEATTACVRAAGTVSPVAQPVLCGATVSVSTSVSTSAGTTGGTTGGTVNFASAVLRNGNFISILSGRVPFTLL